MIFTQLSKYPETIDYTLYIGKFYSTLITSQYNFEFLKSENYDGDFKSCLHGGETKVQSQIKVEASTFCVKNS